jgi:predicted nucleic acid-binding Zn ribbon protein
MGRKKKFCSDKCRWAFWKYETRHKAEKLEMEAKLNENS